jgi:protein-disulfide isomerase
MKKTIFVNLFGGPGTGKSTLCAGIFSQLKIKGIDCEMALEYVKDLVWEESFEKIKTEYVDNGKVAFIFRNFPLNHPALAGAMVSECVAKNSQNPSEKYYSATKILFKTQDNWAFDQKFIEKLEAIFKLDGMSSEAFKACVNDKNLQEKILKHRMEVAKSLFIKSTPSFFVNGEISEGYVDYLTLKKLIDKKLEEAKK